MNTSISDLLTMLCKLLNENKVEDISLLNARCIKSLSTFNNVDEMLDYIKSTYCDSILIKKKGYKSYTEAIDIYKTNGFKLNQKSITIYLKTMKPNGKLDTHLIRF